MVGDSKRPDEPWEIDPAGLDDAEPGDQPATQLDQIIVKTISDRIVLVIYADIISVIAAWMWWSVREFLDGDAWGEMIVRFILHDFIFSIWLVAAAMVLHAMAPQTTARLLHQCLAKLGLVLTIIITIALFAAVVSFVMLMVDEWN
jgi:hypothetical protein